MSRPGSRLVLVTGGASGIGLAIARRFHQAGDQLVLADLNDSTGEAAAAALDASYRHLDVADEVFLQLLLSHGKIFPCILFKFNVFAFYLGVID